MKYAKYVFILMWTLVRKVIGVPMFFLVAPFRKYARRVVYNYKLANGLYLKRMYERRQTDVGSHYAVYPKGILKKRHITTIEYIIVYWLIWGWLDDDSNYDTMDKGFLKTIRDGERKTLVNKYFGKQIQDAINAMDSARFGNVFDLGDARTPCFHWLGTLMWVTRNTAYNFKYDQYETINTDDLFLFEVFGKKFGWIPQDKPRGIHNYRLVFWER